MERNDGRKISHDIENPLDNGIIAMANWLNINVFHPLRFTPNMITSLSLVVGISSPVLFHYKRYYEAAAMFLLAYILDCADGNYARMYNMVTPMGDLYDHISDVSKIIFLAIAFAIHPIEIKTKVMVFGLLAVLAGGMTVHLGCQERVYAQMDDAQMDDTQGSQGSQGSQSPSLDFTKCMCPDKGMIKITRYVGVGTFIMTIVLLMVVMGMLKMKMKMKMNKK